MILQRGYFKRNFWQELGLSAAGSAIGSLLGIGSSGISYNQQKALMSKQYEYQKDFFNYTSEYNSPQNQVTRLEEAGINPALALGQVQTVSGMPGALPNASRQDPKMGSPDFSRALNDGAQRSALSSQADYNNAQAEKARVEAIGVMYDNYKKAFDSKDENMQKRFEAEINALSSQADRDSAIAEKTGVEIGLVEAQKIVEFAKANNINQNTALLFEKMLTERENRKNVIATFDKIVAEAGKINADKFLLGLLAEKMKIEKPFWHTNAYNEASLIIQKASKTGKLMDAEINQLNALAAQSVATSGSEIWDIILDIVGLVVGRNTRKVGFK